MIQILHGWGKRPLELQNTRMYWPEELARMCSRRTGPFWLEVEGRQIQLREEEYDLALQVAAQYHNVISRDAPMRSEDTEFLEERARLHMEESSSDEDNYVTSDEDLIYETYAYI